MTINSRAQVVVAGPDYIKTLLDTDGDGRADLAKLFSKLPASGAHGMCFLGNDLVFTGDNMLGILRDADGDGVADGPPEKWATLRHPEHGANGIVQGPDGWLYVICGNDSGLGVEHVQMAGSPVKEPRCGGVLRISPDGKKMEVVAHGFRNPYDLDFGVHGELFTVDADGERDHHLPWYAPTRMFDIASGGEHGWLLAGWQRSWNRPESYFDNVDRACEFGRGSPTGLVVYRHRQFPEKYRGAVLHACWSTGRVYLCPLEPHGSTVRSKPEVFVQTSGDVGFAPVDLAVGPQGDLFIAIGGRGTRGSVFKISHPWKGPAPIAFRGTRGVFFADQPLSAWSRAEWIPLAKKLGKEAFVAELLDDFDDHFHCLRAAEVLTELFDGVPLDAAQKWLESDKASASEVQARVLWAMARHPRADALPIIAAATKLSDPHVQRCAFEALATVASYHPAPNDLSVKWSLAADSPDRRIRAAAIRAAVAANCTGKLPATARLWIKPEIRRDEAFFAAAMEMFVQPLHGVASQLEAIRLMQLGLGDLRVQPGQQEVYSGYSGNAVHEVAAEVRQRVVNGLASKFPTSDAELNRELARLLGMLSADSAGLPEAISTRWTANSDPRDDIHFLIVASRLPGERSEAVTARAADMLAGLHDKMRARHFYPSRNWPLRVGEAFSELCRRDSHLAAALVQHPKFGSADHSLFAALLPEALRPAAARKLLATALKTDEDENGWSSELVGVLAALPDDEILPHLRKKWEDYGLRDAILPVLARRPQPEDRGRFLEALTSTQAEVVLTAARALAKLQKPDGADPPREFAALIKGLRNACTVKQLREQRQTIGQLLRDWTGQVIELSETNDGALAWQPWQAWFASAYPNHAALLAGAGGADLAQWKTRLQDIAWDQADVSRGKQFFEKKACHRCHVGATRLGPDLVGISGRFSREDLLTAIVDPSRAVSPTYRTTMIVTHSGKTYQGLEVYESPDATLLQTGPDVTVRISGAELAAKHPGTQSLMPVGLLNDASDAEVADLFAYLKTLTK